MLQLFLNNLNNTSVLADYRVTRLNFELICIEPVINSQYKLRNTGHFMKFQMGVRDKTILEHIQYYGTFCAFFTTKDMETIGDDVPFMYTVRRSLARSVG